MGFKIITRISKAPGELTIQLNGLSLSALVASAATEAGPTFSQPVPDDVAAAILADEGLRKHFTVEDEPAAAVDAPTVAESVPAKRRATGGGGVSSVGGGAGE